jgi:glycosyltransferase involved in cell wall biosynthesis
MMDIFVHAAASEAFGLVVAEAMMAARPVVATRVGGIPQVVSEGETALLVAPGDPHALAQAILQLAEQPDLAARFGEAGRIRAEREFGWQRYAREMDMLYTECLDGKRLAGAR